MLADYCGSSRELERRDISCLLSDYPDYAPIDLFVDYYVLVHLSLSLSLSLVSSYRRMIVLVMMMVMMVMLASDQRWTGLAGGLAGWLAGETDPWLRDFSDIILVYTVVPACGGLGCECCLC